MMNTENAERPISVEIQSSKGLALDRGKHGPLNKTRRQEHNRRRCDSGDSFTVYSSDEGQLGNKHCGHKPTIRTSDSDLCLQENESRQPANISATLISGYNVKPSGHSYNYYDVQYSNAMELSQRDRKSEQAFKLEGQIPQSFAACDEYVNKLMKQASEILEDENVSKYFRRIGNERHKPNSHSADVERCCQEASECTHLLESRVSAPTRNTSSASEGSSKSNVEGKVSKLGSYFDNQGHEKYKNVSQHQNREDWMEQGNRMSEREFINFDTKSRGDYGVPFAASKEDYIRYHESDADCQSTYLDSGPKKQHSRHSRCSLDAERQSRLFDQETLHSENTPQASKQQHEDSRVLHKTSDCDYNYADTTGKNKNFSYSQNLGDLSEFASNSALTKQRLWEQTIIEESTVSGDTSKCPYPSVEEEIADDLTRPVLRPKNVTKQRPVLNNNGHPVMLMSLDNQEQSSNHRLICDRKEVKSFRQSPSNLQSAEVFSNDENSKDESTLRGLWRPNAYGTGSSLDTVTTSSEDEAVGESMWTCTRWTDENSEDTLPQSKGSQWAYEVYSNTCQQPARQSGKEAMHKTSKHSHGNTPEFEHPRKQVPTSRREHSDVHKCSNFIKSSVSERDRCSWSSKLDLLFDDNRNVGTLPDFTDILKDCLQLPPDEMAIKPKDHSRKMKNKIATKYTHKMCKDNQESVDDTVVKLAADSFEKVTRSHNAKETSDCDRTSSRLDGISDARQAVEEYPKGWSDVSKLMDNPPCMDELGFHNCRAEHISPPHISSIIDEKLMRTVHSIKEDIEGVLQMLSSLDSQGGEKDLAVSILNEVLPMGKPFTVSNVNCATDFVKQAYNKLISFKNAFLGTSNEEEEFSSYDEYRKSRDDYISDPDVPEEEYQIENIFYRNDRPTSRSSRTGLNRATVEKGASKYVTQKLKTDKKSSKVGPLSTSRKIARDTLMDKKTANEKVRLDEKGSLARPGTEMSQYSLAEHVDHTLPNKGGVKGLVQLGKKNTHFATRPRSNSGKRHREGKKQKERRSAVSIIHGSTDLKHARSGDRATLAFVSPNSKWRKGSPSPVTTKDGRYAYGSYPLPTFLDSLEDIIDETKHIRRQIKIQVDKVIPRRSPVEKSSKSPTTKISLTDVKKQATDSTTPPLKKETNIKENVTEDDTKRKTSSRSADVGKTNKSNLINKVKTVTRKKDLTPAQKLTGRSKRDNQIIGSKLNLKTSQDTKDGGERNTPLSKSESKRNVPESQSVTDTLPTADDAASLLNNSLSQEAAVATEKFVNRYMVVSEVVETTTQGDRSTVAQDVLAKLPITPQPEILTPSSSRRSKRSGRRTRSRSRSRSRSRTKRRKKSKLYTEQRDNEAARFSSSDNILFKKPNHEKSRQTTKAHYQEPKEAFRKSATKSDEDSWFHSGIQTSPSARVSQSDVDLARSEKRKRYETADIEEETRHGDESYGNTPNAGTETMDWPLANSYEGLKRKPKSGSLSTVKDKKNQTVVSPRTDRSTSELNVSIKKLYQEINKLRLQLEASAEDAGSRPMPRVDGDGPVKFARSYKVFTQPAPIFTEPVYTYRQSPEFGFRNVSQRLDLPVFSHSQHTLSDTHTNTYNENTPVNCDRVNEFMAFLESRIRTLDCPETKVYSNVLPNMETVTENCTEIRQIAANHDNNPSSGNMELSQSVVTAKEISTCLNEEVFVTATCNTTDNSDTQNDATEKFDTAPSDNEYSSCNLKDVKPNEATVCSSVNNNMRPTESAMCPGMATNYQKGFTVEKQSLNVPPGKSVYFQSDSAKVYEVSSGDQDKSMCHQHISNRLNSSEKKDHHCLVELCSETSNRFKEGSVYVPEINLSGEWGQRSRYKSTTMWEDILNNRVKNSSQNKGSPHSEGASEKLPVQLQVFPGTTTLSPVSNYKDVDLEQTNKTPFLVNCVKEVCLGSTAASPVTVGRSPQERTPAGAKHSPKRSPSNMHRKLSKKDSIVSVSDVDEVSVAGYIEASRGQQYLRRTQNNITNSECSPVVNNYLQNKQRMHGSPKSQSRTYLQGITVQNGGSLAHKALDWKGELQDGHMRTMNEVISNCGLDNKGTTLKQRDLQGESMTPRLVESNSPSQAQIIETDKIMNHYSDAISTKLSKGGVSRPFSKSGVAAVSKTREHISEKTNADFSGSHRHYLKGHSLDNTKITPQQTPGSKKTDFSQFDDGPRSSLEISDILSDKKAFLLPGGALNADQNSIIASFESMMQKRRPYYVEHCGFRQNNRDTVLGDYELERSDAKSGQSEFLEIKPGFQVVTVVNDNNSSTDLKPSTVVAHTFENNTEELSGDICEDNDLDTDSDTAVASILGQEKNLTFWNVENVVRSTNIPEAMFDDNPGKFTDGDLWGDPEDVEEEAETDHSKALLKPQTSIILVGGKGSELPAVVVEDCRDILGDEISDDKENLLLDPDEAESWYKTTDEESDVSNLMKQTDDKINAEKIVDCGNMAEDIDEETDGGENMEEDIGEENGDTDYKLKMSDDDDDSNNGDSYEYDN